MTAELDIHLTDPDGTKHRVTHFTEYSVTQDLNAPAQFSCTLAAIETQREHTAVGGQKAQVFSYGALQQTAYCDERSEATNPSQTDLQVTGRCIRGTLQDSVVDATNLDMTGLTLAKAADRITAPWQPNMVTSIVTNNAANRYLVAGAGGGKYQTKGASKVQVVWTPLSDPPYIQKESVQVKTDPKRYTKSGKKAFGKNSPTYRGITSESLIQSRIKPEDKVGDVLSSLCKDIACLWFVGADGTLIITRPTYGFDASAYGDGIVQKWNKKAGRATGGNVMRSEFNTSIAGRNSEIFAWASVRAEKKSIGGAIRQGWSVKDPHPAFWARNGKTLGAERLHKPDREVFKTLRNSKMVRRRCRTKFEEALLTGWALSYQVYGHTINGVMPVVDSMIQVYDERYDLTGPIKGGPYYITRVERRFSIADGRTTVLHLIPAKIWLHFDHDVTSDAAYEQHMIERVFW